VKQGPTARSKLIDHRFRSLGFLDLVFLVQTVQVAIGLFNLPRVIVEEAGHNGWMAILFAGLIAQFGVWMIALLVKRFPDLDLYEILVRLYGKWIGRVIGFLFAAYCLCLGTLVGRTYIEVVQLWLFPTTSSNVFFFLLLFPCYYVATAGARVLGRFGVLTFFATSWMILLLYAPASMITKEYYFPLFESSAWQLALATWKVSTSILGFELLLVFHVYAKKKEKILLASSIGIWITTGIYLLVTLIAIGFYSPGQIMKVISPTLHMFQVVELPMIERIEHIGISTWSFLVISTAAPYLWSAGRYLYSFGKWSEPRSVLVTFPLVYFLGTLGKDAFFMSKYEDILGSIGLVISISLPTLLWLSAVIMRKTDAALPPAEEAPEVNAS
jgi:spore germination protein (amino acid permease)